MIVRGTLKLDELKQMAERMFGNFVKAVVDVERELLAVDAELHADLEAELLEDGSEQRHVWGINLYPELPIGEFIEFDSLINMRPSQANKSRGVEDKMTRHRILAIVGKSIRR
jgi:hypothetical protein